MVSTIQPRMVCLTRTLPTEPKPMRSQRATLSSMSRYETCRPHSRMVNVHWLHVWFCPFGSTGLCGPSDLGTTGHGHSELLLRPREEVALDRKPPMRRLRPAGLAYGERLPLASVLHDGDHGVA